MSNEILEGTGLNTIEALYSASDLHRELLSTISVLPAPMLARLSKDSTSDVRANVAQHSNTPIPILTKLGKDNSEEVRKYVAQNPNTGIRTMRKLLYDDSDIVQHCASHTLYNPLIQEFVKTGRINRPRKKRKSMFATQRLSR